MKVIIYSLNDDGSIPNYIIDGGHFPVANNNSSPSDFDLVGIASDEAPQDGFANETELLGYVQDKNFNFNNPYTQENISVESVVSILWSKVVESYK